MLSKGNILINQGGLLRNLILVFIIANPVRSDPRKVALQRHNVYRAGHESTPSLQLSNNLSAFVSQKWADRLLKENSFRHSTLNSYGENLWSCYGCKYSSEEAVRRAIDSWYKEIKLYNWNHPGFSSATGHFTAMIWKSAKRLGVGVARNGKRIIVVTHYSPVTNIIGEFRANVKPKK